MERLDHTMQLVLEQMADLKRQRFGRSTERHEADEQISFMEVDGKIVFFNEAEAAASEGAAENDGGPVKRRPPKKEKGKREEDLSGLPVSVIEHSIPEEELEEIFGKGAGSSCRTKYTTGTALPLRRWRWKNTM